MVLYLLRLKLRLLANGFRRSPWQVVGMIVGLLYGVGVAVLGAVGLLALRIAPVDVAAPVVSVGGSIVVLGFLVVPLVFGVDDTMDPRKFALLGMPTTRLAVGLAVAALVAVPALALAILALAQIVTWTRDPLSFVLAVVGAPLVLLTCVLGSRVTTGLAALLLATRRARESSALVGVLVLVLISPAAVILADLDWSHDGLAVLQRIADVAAWTPLGAVWSAPAAAAAGDVGGALLRLLVALAFLAVLALAWRWLVGVILVTPHRESRAKRYSGLGWFGVLPATPAGVIAARSLTYWARDARYRISLVVIPIVPLIMLVPLIVVGVGSSVAWLLPVPVMALFLAWSAHNDVAFDNTAIWLHVASNTRGWADRLGRVVPALLYGTPLIVVGSAVCAWGYGRGGVFACLLGVSACVLYAGLGLSSVMSAAFPYPAVRPGDNPFQQPQAAGSASALIQSLSFVAILLVSLPTIVLAGLGLFVGAPWNWLALLAGVVEGVGLLWVGVSGGGRVFDRRAPELLAFSLRN